MKYQKELNLSVGLCRHSLATNGSQLPEGGDLRTNFHPENCRSNIHKTVLRSTSPPLLGRCCYRQWFCLSCQCPPCFQRFYCPFNCPEKRFYLSAMSGRERFNYCEAREFFSVPVRLLLAYLFVLQVGLALCRPQERGRQCAKSVMAQKV